MFSCDEFSDKFRGILRYGYIFSARCVIFYSFNVRNEFWSVEEGVFATEIGVGKKLGIPKMACCGSFFFKDEEKILLVSTLALT